MDLHGQIMNLPADGATLDWANTREAYLHGHRDARHSAAELALKTEAQLRQENEELRRDAARYRWLRDRMTLDDPDAWDIVMGESVKAWDAAIDAQLARR